MFDRLPAFLSVFREDHSQAILDNDAMGYVVFFVVVKLSELILKVDCTLTSPCFVLFRKMKGVKAGKLTSFYFFSLWFCFALFGDRV